MLSVNISSLKNNLSAMLRKVKKGESILILERYEPIAKITAVSSAETHGDDDLLLAELERKGIISRPKKRKIPTEWLRKNLVHASASAVQALLDEREESER